MFEEVPSVDVLREISDCDLLDDFGIRYLYGGLTSLEESGMTDEGARNLLPQLDGYRKGQGLQ